MVKYGYYDLFCLLFLDWQGLFGSPSSIRPFPWSPDTDSHRVLRFKRLKGKLRWTASQTPKGAEGEVKGVGTDSGSVFDAWAWPKPLYVYIGVRVGKLKLRCHINSCIWRVRADIMVDSEVKLSHVIYLGSFSVVRDSESGTPPRWAVRAPYL